MFNVYIFSFYQFSLFSHLISIEKVSDRKKTNKINGISTMILEQMGSEFLGDRPLNVIFVFEHCLFIENTNLCVWK